MLKHPWCTDASLIQGKKRALSIYISIKGVNVGEHERNIRTEPQYLPRSYCVWWGWVGRPCAAGSPGSSPAGCRRTPQSRRRRAGSPTPEQDRKVIGDWLEKLSGSASAVLFILGILLGKTNRHFSLVSAFIWPAKVCVKSHHLGSAEARHLNASVVMAVEVKAVERGQQPQIDTGDPHQHRVLETLGQVWVGCVPRTVPVLQRRENEKAQNSYQDNMLES